MTSKQTYVFNWLSQSSDLNPIFKLWKNLKKNFFQTLFIYLTIAVTLLFSSNTVQTMFVELV